MKMTHILLCVMTAAMLSSCAAGSATAGYALKAQSADSLTTQAEQRLVDRIKGELIQGHCPVRCVPVQTLN